MSGDRTVPEPAEAAAALAALARVEGSTTFQASRQARTLLRYLVERWLAGESDGLKGYTVGVEALGRPADFDPSSDPSARVAMRRLRKLLADYAGGEGAADDAVLELDAGAFTPRLRWRLAEVVPAAPASAPASAPGAPARRRLAWVSLAAIGVAGLAWLMAEDWRQEKVSAALEFRASSCATTRQSLITPAPAPAAPDWPDRLPVLVVLPWTITGQAPPGPARDAPTQLARDAPTQLGRDAPAQPGRDAPTQLGRDAPAQLAEALARFSDIEVRQGEAGAAAYALAGRIQAARAAPHPFTTTLTDLRSATVLGVFDGTLGDDGLDRETLQFIATAIGQVYGLVNSRERSLWPPGFVGDGHSCVLAMAEYWRHYRAAALPGITACLERAVEAAPAQAPPRVALALARLERHRLATTPEPGGLDDAYRLARLALQDAPFDARAHQALGAVLYARGDVAGGIASLRQARGRNPFAPDIAADLAARLLGTGEVTEARALLGEACRFVAARPAWMDFTIFLGAVLDEDWPAAVDRAGRMIDDGFVLNLVARLIAARLRQDAPAAARWTAALAARDPAWLTNPAPMLDRYLGSDAVTAGLARLMQAGPAGVAPVPIGRSGGCLADRAPAADR